jgi:tripartite-type tricarboxylate transporter receptor subunit TctC
VLSNNRRQRLVVENRAGGVAQFRGRNLRGIDTTGTRRSSALPDLRSVAKIVQDFAGTTWNAVLAPSGTPDSTLAANSTAISAALGDASFQAHGRTRRRSAAGAGFHHRGGAAIRLVENRDVGEADRRGRHPHGLIQRALR